MKSKIFLLFLVLVVTTSCNQSATSSDSQASQNEVDAKPKESMKTVEQSTTSEKLNTENQNTVNTNNNSSIEQDIQFIRDKFAIISKATNYKTVPFETQCDERSSTKLERKYNEKGELRYLKYMDCGGHGCVTKQHYYWGGELIFIFYVNDFTPGSSHLIQEHRSYFKNGEMIRCLEKEARYYEGQAPMAELLKKAKNEEVDCVPEKLTANLSKLESLSLEEAQTYFCGSSSEVRDTLN